MSFRKRDFERLNASAVIKTAEQIVSGAVNADGALRWLHVENGLIKLREDLDHFINETKGETRCRLMMARLMVEDSADQFDAERDGEDNADV